MSQGLLITVLAVSTVSKLRSKTAFDDFQQSLRKSELTPSTSARPAAMGLVTAEGITALLLVVPPTRELGFVTATVLFGMLTAGVAVIVRRGRQVTCQCFGPSDSLLAVRHVIRNAILASAAVIGALSAPAHVDAVALTVILMGAVVAVPIVLLDDLSYLFRSATHTEARR